MFVCLSFIQYWIGQIHKQNLIKLMVFDWFFARTVKTRRRSFCNAVTSMPPPLSCMRRNVSANGPDRSLKSIWCQNEKRFRNRNAWFMNFTQTYSLSLYVFVWFKILIYFNLLANVANSRHIVVAQVQWLSTSTPAQPKYITCTIACSLVFLVAHEQSNKIKSKIK